jgi:hypothetical protein
MLALSVSMIPLLTVPLFLDLSAATKDARCWCWTG